MLICLFHSLRAFKREVGKLDLKEGQIVVAKENYQKLCYSRDQSTYQENYENLKKRIPLK